MFKRKADDGVDGDATKAGADGVRKATFARNLAALNSQFAAWVAEQAASAPKELWTDGVEDYLKYAKQLLVDFKDVLEAEPADKQAPAAAPAAPTAAGSKPEAPVAAGAKPEAPAAGSSKPPLAPGGLFSGAGGTVAPPASIFGSLPAAAPAGSGGGGGGGAFGLGGGAPAFGGFGGSGAGSAANSGGSGLFNVPSTGTLGSSFNTGAVTAANDDDGEGEEEQPAEPSVQVEAGEGTELLAKQRVKLMSINAEKKWGDKGKGTLTLRRATGEEAAGKRPYFVFTTDSGRILLNAPLLKGAKATGNPKAPAAVIMHLISVVDGKQEAAMHMFKCESPEAAKQLMQTIQEHNG